MERLFLKILFIYTLIGLIMSCAPKVFTESSNTVSGTAGPEDTTGSAIPFKIDTFRLDILPPSLGVQFYRDGIVFLSLSKNEEKMLSGHLSFGNVQAYYSEIKDSATGQHILFSPSSSFTYPCEAVSFTNDFNTMYFTRISEADKHEKIYRASAAAPGSNQSGWTMDSEPLSFCRNGSNYSHPAVSSDGNMMIFASDNPGSSGGMDLFITKKISGEWGEPKNIGIAINTKGNELFPFLDADNNLFFSSDGHSGSGGYDIFMSKFRGNSWGIPLNLTRHINTPNDEVAFTMDRVGGNQAFFSSRQKSQTGEVQLYRLTLKEGKLKNDTVRLSNILYSMALSEIDSVEVKKIMGMLEAERNKAEKIKADSIEEARMEAQKANRERMRADSIEKAGIEAERIKADSIKADSIRAALAGAEKLKADSIEADMIYREKLEAAKDSTEAVRIKAERDEAERARIAKLGADSIQEAKIKEQQLTAEMARAEKMKADSIEATSREAERVKEKFRADSILAAKKEASKLKAERTRRAKFVADSILAAKKEVMSLESERTRRAKLEADSILAAKKEAERIEAERNKAREDSIETARLEAYNKENNGVIIYKVQILSSIKRKAGTEISLNGVKYIPDEYFYLNEYRYTIGEFNTLKPAVELQNACRKSGYPHAFVAAFKNGSRILDMEVFK